MPFAFIAATIWSASACFTRGSFAPWRDQERPLDRVDVRERRALLEELLALLRCAGRRRGATSSSKNDFQYGGIDSSSVLRFDGPTMSTPQAKRSGVKVRPTSVA